MAVRVVLMILVSEGQGEEITGQWKTRTGSCSCKRVWMQSTTKSWQGQRGQLWVTKGEFVEDTGEKTSAADEK
jgi:hypothetical protein